MKVNQIVGEHKKGVKAKIYAKKPIPLIGPEALKRKEDAKKKAASNTTANEELASMTGSSAKVVANDGRTITIAMPDGTQIQKPIGPNMLSTDQQGKAIVNLNTQQVQGQAPGAPSAPQQNPQDMFARGKDVMVNTGEPVEELSDEYNAEELRSIKRLSGI
jgi:hypothetical protein